MTDKLAIEFFTKNRALIILALYGLLISLLLVFKGCEPSVQPQLNYLKKKADSLKNINNDIYLENLQWSIKFNKLEYRLISIDSHLLNLENKRERVRIVYRDLKENLSKLDSDSLKKTALME